MEKRIELPVDAQKSICAAFGITDRMVRYSLSYDRDTDLAKRVRKLALQKGGRVVYTLPEMETMHDADGMIRQYLPGGITIELDKRDGSGRILYDGATVWSEEGVRVDDIGRIQQLAASMADRKRTE